MDPALSDLHIAADNHEVALTGRSISDSISDIATKGVQLTALSIYNSFVNTGVDVINFFGGEAERNDPIEQLQGHDDDLLQYYKEHAEGIEAAGLVLGSFIPGGAAVKALKLASVGKHGINTAIATGLMTGKKQKVIREAIEEINNGDAALFGNITASKLKALAYGFGEQAIQAAAWETATIATMKANPLLDKDGFEDIMSHLFWGTLVGGGIGGVIEGIGSRAIINKALRDQDVKEKVFDLATHLGLGNFNAGDRVVQLINSIDEMPLPTTRGAEIKAARTKSAAEIDAWKILKTISPDADEPLGKTFLDALYRMRNESQLSKEEMYDYLGRLAKISRIDSQSHIKPDDIFYIREFADDTSITWSDLVSSPGAAGFVEAQSKATKSIPYAMKPGVTDIRLSRYDEIFIAEDGSRIPKYTSKTEAFKAGEDIFIAAPEYKGAKPKVYVNPDTTKFERVARPGESRILGEAEEKIFRETGKLPEGSQPLYGAPVFFNVFTGEVKNKGYAVVGDLAPINKDEAKKLLSYDSRGYLTGLRIGNNSFTHYVESGFNYHDITALDANAR